VMLADDHDAEPGLITVNLGKIFVKILAPEFMFFKLVVKNGDTLGLQFFHQLLDDHAVLAGECEREIVDMACRSCCLCELIGASLLGGGSLRRLLRRNSLCCL